MENIRLFFSVLAQVQTNKAGISERLVVVAIFETRESGYSIDADAEQVMRIGLKKRQRLRS
jgi:hypothetical protein